MARFDFLKPDQLKARIVNSTILKSKAFHIAIGSCVFCFALGTGLSYLIVQTAQTEQLVVLGESSERMADVFLKRLTDLDAEAQDVKQRVELVSTQIVDAAHVAGTPPPTGEVPAEPSSGATIAGASPLEVRWRERLEASLREVMKDRADILDVTYLGRFTGIPNGPLTVVRIERNEMGALLTSREDPRSDWDASFLQTVIQSKVDGAWISTPTVVGTGEDAYAIIRGADPVRDQNGAVIGVAMVSLGLTSLLEDMTKQVPEIAKPLLVTDQGLALLHPQPEENLVSAETGTRVIDGLFPGLLFDFKKNRGATRHAFAAETFVAHLDRITVGDKGGDVKFSLVLSSPYVPIDLATAVSSAGTLAAAVVSGNNPTSLAVLGSLVLGLSAGGVVWIRRKKLLAAAADAIDPEQAPADVLAERANAIEAEEEEDAPLEASEASDALGDNAEEDAPLEVAAAEGEPSDDESDAERPDEAAAAVASAANEEEEQAESAEDPMLEEGDVYQAVDVAKDAAALDEPAQGDEPSAGAQLSEPELPESISAESLASARSLSDTRSRLEVELEEARQRSLDELASARERFEVELAGERDRAISRLIEESRQALAADTYDDVELTSESSSSVEVPSIEKGEFDLRNLLAEVSAWMQGEIHGRDQSFCVRCHRDVPNQLVGDPDWLGPLLVNLGKSAAASSASGPIEFVVKAADDGATGVRMSFELRAEDTGFEALPGGRVGERRPGSLAMVEDIVESMHGELSVASAPDGDSALRVVLPMSLPS